MGRDAMRGLTSVVLIVLLTATCTSRESGSTNVLQLSEGPLIVSDVIRELRPTLDDTVGLHVIRDIELHGDTVIVADRNPRIVLLDRSFRLLASLGREGQGPGELRRPGDLAVSRDGFVVYDPPNNRAARFGFDGAARGSVPMSGWRITNLAVDGRGRILATMNDSVHHLLAMDPEGGDSRMLAPRVTDLGEPVELGGEEIPADWDLVAVTGGNRIHVLDGKGAALSTYSPEGELLASRQLPEPLRSRVMEGVGVFREDFGLRMHMPFRDLEATADGRLLVMFTSGSAGDTLGLVVDPESYRARVLRTDTERPAWKEGRAPTAMALDGDRLLVGWFTGALVEFAVEE